MSNFAYAIDYEAAIAEDEAEVARLSSEVQVAVSAEMDTQEVNPNRRFTHYDFVLVADVEVRTRRAALLGATEYEALCFAYGCDGGQYADVKGTDEQAAAMEALTNREFYQVGARFEAAMKAVESIDLVTEKTRKEWLKKAKSTLSRHKRNQKKHGSK